ncbi:MAG TPA: tyrosine-type recombinase/integrase [Armatimonadota bacterium]|jgi:site-specific recombinase XerD
MTTSQTSQVITVQSAVEEFIVSRKLANLSPRTVAWYEEKLGTLLAGLEDLPLSELTIHVYRDRIATRASQVKPATVSHHIRAFKTMMRWLAEEDEYTIGLNPRKIKQMTTEKRNPPVLTKEQVTVLLKQPDQSQWTGRRDNCLLSLLLDTGIRISEALTAEVGGWDEEQGTLSVIGKGNKQRIVALSLPMRRIMRKWCRVRAQVCRKQYSDCPAIFLSRRGGALKYRGVAGIIQRYGEKAGIEGVRVSPHTFRSTFATNFCRDGGSIVHLQTILGHTTMEMSRRYAVVADEDAFESSRKFSMLADIMK